MKWPCNMTEKKLEHINMALSNELIVFKTFLNIVDNQ